MSRQRICLAAVSFLLALAACGNKNSSGNGNEPPNIAAHWVSDCVPNSTGAIKLDNVVDAARWSLNYDIFNDAACAVPFVTIHIQGPYELTEPSTVVSDAWNARFAFDQKTATPHGAAAVGFLTGLGDACGGPGTWSDGVARDVYATGCAKLGQYPSSSCSADYDLVNVNAAGELHLGQRPADNNMCTEAKRPTALSQVGLKRTSP